MSEQKQGQGPWEGIEAGKAAAPSISELEAERDCLKALNVELLAACKATAAGLQPSIFDDDGECRTWLAEFDTLAREALLATIARAEEKP